MAGLASLPTRTVEVAFTGTDTTPTWTDISHYVMTIDPDRGRNREIDQFSAGTVKLRLRNDDRRFDPEYAAGPNFGNLLPGKPLRVRATWNAITYDLFRGYVDEWPQSYKPPRAAFSDVSATDATKILARLLVPSEYRQVVALDNPSAWFPLDDPVGTNPVHNIGSTMLPAGVSTQVVLGGSGVVPGDGGTSAAFNDDGGYIDAARAGPPGPTGTTWTIEGWFKTDTTTTDFSSTIVNLTDIGGFVRINLGVDGTVGTRGLVTLYTTNSVGGFTSLSSAARFDDDLPHHFAIISNGTNIALYLDGVSQGSIVATYGMPTTYWFTLFGVTLDTVIWALGSYMKGDLAHLAIYNGVQLSAARILAHYQAGAGYPGETADTRINRYLDNAGWPATLRSIDVGHVQLAAAPIDEPTGLLELLRTIEATEVGQLYVDRDGKITFRNRWALISDTRSITSNATFSDQPNTLPYQDLEFSYDDTLLRNYVTGQRSGGTPQLAQDATSITTYYRQGYSRPTTNELHDDDVLAACQFLVGNYKDPHTRVEKLVMNGRSTNGTVTANAIWAELLGRRIGDRITVNRTPQAVGAAISKQLIIEGISHAITPENWVTTFRVSPVLGEDQAGITGYLIWGGTGARTLWDENRWAI